MEINRKMQELSGYKWLLILVFISILIVIMAYLVSEKLIRHLDEKSLPAGMIHPALYDDCVAGTIFPLDNKITFKIFRK